MEYINIEGIEKPVSRILFGTTHLTEYNPTTKALLNSVTEMGITALDTARVYSDGKSESVLGQWMEDMGNREKLVILSKGGHPDFTSRKMRISRDEILYDIKKSLESLKTDYVDIYLLHRDDPSVPVSEIMDTLAGLKAEGKIRVYGGSNWTIPRLMEANAYAAKMGLPPMMVSSPYYGLGEQLTDIWGWGCVSIAGPQNAEAREWYVNNQMPVVAYSSLSRGMFTGKVQADFPENIGEVLDQASIDAYGSADNFERLRRCEELALKKNASVAQIAMGWLLRQKVNVCAVVSSRKAERMMENLKAFEIMFSDEELNYLDLR